jgi:hypothetical protein
MAIMKVGHTKFVTLNPCATDIIHAVIVVPMFAPIMTEIACANVRRPALTKLTVITVVAVELCTAAVTKTPVSIPVNRFVVMVPRICRKPGPAIFCSASDIVFIPNIRRPSEPNILKIKTPRLIS